MSASISSSSLSKLAFAINRPFSKVVWCTSCWYLLDVSYGYEAVWDRQSGAKSWRSAPDLWGGHTRLFGQVTHSSG